MTSDFKDWIQYADGTFEPIRAGGQLEKKRRGPGIPDWWVVRKPAAWRPGTSGKAGVMGRVPGDVGVTLEGAEGRITGRVLRLGDVQRRWEYRYDEAGRLAEARRDTGLVESYLYDAHGRRFWDVCQRNTYRRREFAYGPDNRLLAAGKARFEHDAQGFRSARHDEHGTARYQYAPDHRLLAATLPDGTEIDYAHDEAGRRVAKHVDGSIAETYQWLDFLRLGVFEDATGRMEFLYQADSRLPFGMLKSGVRYALHYDQVGSLMAVADASGNVIKRIEYDAFGNQLEDTAPGLRIPLGFAGGLTDPDTGFVRFGWRDYDPDTGRWTAKDPIGAAGGDTDWYGYCLDDPVNGVDPLGLKGVDSSGTTELPGLYKGYLSSEEKEVLDETVKSKLDGYKVLIQAPDPFGCFSSCHVMKKRKHDLDIIAEKGGVWEKKAVQSAKENLGHMDVFWQQLKEGFGM